MPGTGAPLPGSDAALIGLAALGIVLVPFLWPLARHFSVMAHEGAHAVVLSALGLTVTGVTLNKSAGGATSFVTFRDKGLRMTLPAFAGYLGPSAFGLWAAKLIETGHVVTVPWLAIILLVLLLFLIRKSFGVVSVPVAITLLALTTRYGRTGLEEGITYLMTWLLLLSGVGVVRMRGTDAADAWELNRMTRVPRGIWVLLWLAGTLLAVIIGGKWMILRS